MRSAYRVWDGPGDGEVGDYVVRRARPDDLDRLVDLHHALQDCLEAANPALWRMTADGRAAVRGQLAARLPAPQACALVAEHRVDGVVGMIFGRATVNSRYTPPRAGVIDQLFVSPDHRRRGVASALLAALCRFFAAHGVEDLSLRYVHGNAEAEAFWAAMGFAPRIVTVGAARQAVEAHLAPPSQAMPG